MQKLTREQAIDWMMDNRDKFLLINNSLYKLSDLGQLERPFGDTPCFFDEFISDVTEHGAEIYKPTPEIDPALLELKKMLTDATEKLNKLMEGK